MLFYATSQKVSAAFSPGHHGTAPTHRLSMAHSGSTKENPRRVGVAPWRNDAPRGLLAQGSSFGTAEEAVVFLRETWILRCWNNMEPWLKYAEIIRFHFEIR